MCQWILIAVLSVSSVSSPSQSFWNVGMWSQPSRRSLINNSGSYSRQFTAKLLQNFCFEPQSVALCLGAVEFMGSVCPESFVGVCGVECIPTFENLLHRGVLAFGRWTVHVIDSNNISTSSVLSVLRRSMTSLLYSAWGPNPPNARELRLCRLHSSIVYLSIIDEKCGYRIPQPFGSWGLFMIPVVVLISIGMLALYSAARIANVSPPFLRPSVRGMRKASQTAASSVQ